MSFDTAKTFHVGLRPLSLWTKSFIFRAFPTIRLFVELISILTTRFYFFFRFESKMILFYIFGIILPPRIYIFTPWNQNNTKQTFHFIALRCVGRRLFRPNWPNWLVGQNILFSSHELLLLCWSFGITNAMRHITCSTHNTHLLQSICRCLSAQYLWRLLQLQLHSSMCVATILDFL